MIRTLNSSQGKITFGLICAFLLLILASGGWYATWRHYQADALTPVCNGGDLHLSIGTSNGTAGTQYTDALLTNQGNGSCAIGGYPSVFLANASYAKLGLGAVPNPLYAPKSITLAPGQTAHTVLGFPDHTAFSQPNTCSPVSVNVVLYVPGVLAPFEVPLAQYSCPGFSATAFQPGD